MSIQDPRASERYMPRWEIWMGVFLHYAFSNVVNSLSSFQVTTQSVQGVMSSETKVAWDKLAGCVLILEAHVMDLWRESSKNKKDEDFQKAYELFHEFLKEDPDDIVPLAAMEKSAAYYHQIIQLMHRRGFLRFKPPRSFGRKHDE